MATRAQKTNDVYVKRNQAKFSPDKVARKRADIVVARLEQHDKAYAKGKPLIDDANYDALREKAKGFYPWHSYFKKVGAKVPAKAIKSRMPITVGSLDKVRPIESLAWMKEIEDAQAQQAWYAFPKLDGSSGIILFKNHVRKTVWSRGDGETGRIITEAAKYVQGVPSKLIPIDGFDFEDICVRGEFVMHRSIFDKYYAKSTNLPEGYKHPRNLVVGLLNRIDIENSVQDLRRVTFVAFYVYYKRDGKWMRVPSRHKELVLMQMMGLTVITNPSRYAKGHRAIKDLIKDGHKNLKPLLPIHDVSKSIGSLVVHEKQPTAEQLIKLLAEFKKRIDIPMDGLVLEPGNSKAFIKQGEHLEARPSYIRAVKLDAIDQEFAEGTIKGIDWDVSKRGLLKPVVVLKSPISFDGVDVTNITGNNAAFVKAYGFGVVGGKVRVTRSGDVIPKIVSRLYNGKWVPIEKKAPALKFDYKLPSRCPACNTRLEWNNTDVDLLCPNDQCSGRKAKSMSSFFTTLGADQVASGTIKQLIDAGYTTIPKILAITEAQALKVDGFQKTKAKNLIASLQKMMDQKPLAMVMHASGIFSSSEFALGSTMLAAAVDALTKKYGKGWAAKSRAEIRNEIRGTPGFGEPRVQLFMGKLDTWLAFYAKIRAYHTVSTKSAAAGMVAAFTGFRSPEMEDAITKNGGRIAGVSRNCTVLFCASLGSTKAKKAETLGIKIVAQKDAAKYLDKLGIK